MVLNSRFRKLHCTGEVGLLTKPSILPFSMIILSLQSFFYTKGIYPMPIIRVKKDKNHPYVLLNKKFLDNRKLSFKAKGLLSYLLSKPDDWKFYVEYLKDVSMDGLHSTSQAFLELIKYKYIKKERKRNKQGQFKGFDYTVFEKPYTEIQLSENGLSENGLSDTDNPKTGYPKTDNRKLLINDITNNDTTNNNLSNKKSIKPTKKKYGDFVFLSDNEYNKLVSEYNKEKVQSFIEKLDNYKGSRGKKYKSDYRAILLWVVGAVTGIKKNKDHGVLKNEKDWEY